MKRDHQINQKAKLYHVLYNYTQIPFWIQSIALNFRRKQHNSTNNCFLLSREYLKRVFKWNTLMFINQTGIKNRYRIHCPLRRKIHKSHLQIR